MKVLIDFLVLRDCFRYLQDQIAPLVNGILVMMLPYSLDLKFPSYSGKRAASTMARHPHHTPSQPEMQNEFQNRPYPDHRFVRGQLMPPPNLAAINGDNSPAYFNTPIRSNYHPSCSNNSNYPNYYPANFGASHGTHLHYPPRTDLLANHAQPGPSCHRPHAVTPQTYNRSSELKRKTPDRNPADAYGNYSGSSSDFRYSCGNLQPKPTPAYEQAVPSNPTSITEGFQRNVRSRHSHSNSRPLEFNQIGFNPSNMPQPTSSQANTSGQRIPEQWSHAHVPPHGRSLPSGTVTSSSAATIRDREYYPTQNRNPIIPVPTSPSPYMQGPGSARGVYCNRPAPHLAATSHPSMRSLPIYLGNQAIVPSRQHSRPLATTGHNEDQRERRFGNPYEMLQHFVIVNDFDPYWDMRLDIDDMSYEELLALEERIGNVSMGLCDEAIARCLVETACSSSNQRKDDQEGGICVICQEEYKSEDRLGRLRCKHDFHVECVKEWLLKKNACPVCKTAAAEDTSKKKH
uniref:RING-type E3 ubiquitin transferase n=1 Tax=Ananas comosus var. bracteatus TaxID=296719 RepID=A0A6V7PD73_ANACO|nr:unnamed protein product [Ananas comosus var. bracteatus]